MADNAAGFHTRSDVGILEVQRHFHVNLLLRVNALEVDVLHLLAERVHLEVAQQHGLFFSIQFQRQNGSVERFVAQCVIQGVVIEFDHGSFARTVNDAGNTICFAQTAARTRSLRFA